MKDKLQQVSKQLKSKRLDGLLVTNQANITYLTSITSLSSLERQVYMFLTQKESYLFLPPLVHHLYRDYQNTHIEKLSSRKKLINYIYQISKKYSLKTIGFEEKDVTVAELGLFKKKLLHLNLKEAGGIVERLRLRKSEAELKFIKKACHITDQAYRYILTKIKPGVSEKQLALELEFFIKNKTDDTSFSPIVAFDKNSAIPHFVPSTNKTLSRNSLILFDFGAKVNGYCSDMTRVVFWGNPDGKFKKVYQTVLEAQNIAVRLLGKKTALSGSGIDRQIKDFIKKKAYPIYPHGLGHGVGIEIHEDPRLKLGKKDQLAPQMVFTLEPAIYLQGWGGVRIEDTVLLKEDGAEVLTKSPKDLDTIILK